MKITGAKNNTTQGFLLCFRPFPMEEETTRDVNSSINHDSDLNKSFSVIEKPKSTSKVCSSSDKESIDRNQKKTTRRRFLSKMVKAMAFQSSLSKKVRKGKIIIQDPLRNQKSRRRSSSSSEEEENGSSISSSILSTSSSSLSISSSSSIASSWSTSSDSNRSLGSGRLKSFRSDSIEVEKKQNINSSTSSSTQSSTTTEQKKKQISGICLLLISLFVLIFWGKFFAILCTSTWFYFVSTTRRNSDGDTQRKMLIKSSPVVVGTPTKEYKKKIIMEGFLERNHRGCFHLHQH